MAAHKSTSLVPRLRFPEFRDAEEWESRKLGRIGEFIGGGTPNTSIPEFWGGDVQWFTPSEITGRYLSKSKRTITSEGLQHSSAKLLPAGTLLLSTRATIGDVGIADNPCATNQGFQSLVVFEHEANVFWYYWLLQHRRELIRRSSGSIFLEIGRMDLKQIPTLRPNYSEQTKIAECLGSLDDLIDATGKKIEALRQHKKGLMQKLFPQPGETVPRLRFPEFEDEPRWTGLLLQELESKGKIELGRGKVISHADMRSNPGPYPVYSSSVIDEGFMGAYGDHLFDEELISWSVDGGGNFFYRPKHKFSVTNVSGFMRVLSDDIVCQFLAYQLQRLHGSQIFDYQQKAHPSVIRTLYAVSFPRPDEQLKIAHCLGSLDDLIAVASRKFEALRQHKQGLMQQLFPSLEDQ